jgi:hypothetical protein
MFWLNYGTSISDGLPSGFMFKKNIKKIWVVKKKIWIAAAGWKWAASHGCCTQCSAVALWPWVSQMAAAVGAEGALICRWLSGVQLHATSKWHTHMMHCMKSAAAAMAALVAHGWPPAAGRLPAGGEFMRLAATCLSLKQPPVWYSVHCPAPVKCLWPLHQQVRHVQAAHQEWLPD